MLGTLLIAAALTGSNPDLLDLAIERFTAVQSYRVTLHSSHADGEEHLHYFYRKPGHIRMEFIRPHHGAVLNYDPASRRVRLWPFGAGRFPQLNLSPDNRLIRSPRGQQVDRSDVGALLENVKALRQGGTLTAHEKRLLDERSTLFIDVVGNGSHSIAGVYRYELWLDAETLFPVKVVSHDRSGTVLETVRMEDIEINPDLPSTLFQPQD
jgi:outer membrane lipoprotein-sorting protein